MKFFLLVIGKVIVIRNFQEKHTNVNSIRGLILIDALEKRTTLEQTLQDADAAAEVLVKVEMMVTNLASVVVTTSTSVALCMIWTSKFTAIKGEEVHADAAEAAKAEDADVEAAAEAARAAEVDGLDSQAIHKTPLPPPLPKKILLLSRVK